MVNLAWPKHYSSLLMKQLISRQQETALLSLLRLGLSCSLFFSQLARLLFQKFSYIQYLN